MKKTVSLILAVMLLIAVIPAFSTPASAAGYDAGAAVAALGGAARRAEVELLVELVNDLAILGVDLVLALEGHMAYACPLVLESPDGLGDIVAALDGEGFELLDDGLLPDEVLALFLVLVAEHGFLLVEEFIAGGVEARGRRPGQSGGVARYAGALAL